MAISIASRKQKGRLLQQYTRDALRRIGAKFGLVDDDIHSTAMGQSGVDVILSPAAKKLLPFFIECKSVESLNVFTTFITHFAKYKDAIGLKLLVHKKKNKPTLVTLRFDDFMQIIEENLELKNTNNGPS